MDGDIKLQDVTVEISGDQLQTAVSNIELRFSGGHLSASEGQVELGTHDGSAFMGFRQLKDGTVQIAGDRLKVTVENVEIGSDAGGKFKGFRLRDSGYVDAQVYALTVLNPDFERTDSKQRMALAQGRGDELLMNVHGHYSGGVRIEGATQVEGDLAAQRITVQEALVIPVGSALLFLMPDMIGMNPVTGKKIRMPGKPIDLLATVKDLQEQVKGLQEKIATLEEKARSFS